MNIIYNENISMEDYNALRTAVGWGIMCDEQTQQGLQHSAYIISCYDGDSIVGSARVLWDRGYIAYLTDVMVRPEYQGQGIGTQLVTLSINFVKSQLKVGWRIKIVLLSAKGKESFYKKFGFNERPTETAGPAMDLSLNWES